MPNWLNLTGHPLNAEKLPEDTVIVGEPLVGVNLPLGNSDGINEILVNALKGSIPETLGEEMPVLVCTGPAQVVQAVLVVYNAITGQWPTVCYPTPRDNDNPYGNVVVLAEIRDTLRQSRG